MKDGLESAGQEQNKKLRLETCIRGDPLVNDKILHILLLKDNINFKCLSDTEVSTSFTFQGKVS